MPQFLFATESYPFTADIEALLADPEDEAILITKDAHLALTDAQRSCFRQIIKVDGFDVPRLEQAIASIGRMQPGARIVSHDDFFYELFAEVSRRHGLAGYSADSIRPFVDKHETKKRLDGSGIRAPRYVLFDSEAYAAQQERYVKCIESELAFPMFAKPVQGAGAENCTMLSTQADLRRWCHEWKEGCVYEIDEFVGDAVLYHCDSVIQEGRPIFTQVARYSRPCADFAAGYMVGSHTLAHEEPLSIKLRDFVDHVIAALARHHPVPDGVTHMEVFRTVAGELVFLEVQLRPPGANAKRCYAEYLRLNLEDLHLRLQMGKAVSPPAKPPGPFSAWMYFPTADGIVEKLHPLPSLQSRIVEAEYHVRPGQLTRRPSSILDARGRGVVALSLVISNVDYDELTADFQRLAQHRPFTLVPLRPAISG